MAAAKLAAKTLWPDRLLAVLWLLSPMAAHAEVMDKESSALAVWLWATVPTLLVFISARYRPWCLLLVLPAPLLFFYAQLSETMDPHVGPAMAHEAGIFYTVASWAGPFLLIAAVLLGLFLRCRSKTFQQPQRVRK